MSKNRHVSIKVLNLRASRIAIRTEPNNRNRIAFQYRIIGRVSLMFITKCNFERN